jgi:transcriptional regulator with XRE-family HTH domain
MQQVTWNDFAGCLQKIRKHHHLSQEKLASELRCSRNYIWRLERATRRPSRVLLELIKEKYIKTPDEIHLFQVFESMIEYKCDQFELVE